MRRPCTALVRQDQILKFRTVAMQVAGHLFKEELDWYCENCELRHEPPYDGDELDIEPCPNPTPSRFEEMLMDYLLRNTQTEEPS